MSNSHDPLATQAPKFGIAALLWMQVAAAEAQVGAPNVAQNVSSGRNYYFETALIVVLFGFALFAT